MNRRRLGQLIVAAMGVLSVVIVAGAPETIIAGDPAEYRRRAVAILEGGLPYLDVPFEHLPVMLAPILGAWFLGGAVSQPIYIVVFAALMTSAMIGTFGVMESLGAEFRDRSVGPRWLVLSIPLMPLVIFRNDPVSVLLFAFAALAFATGKTRWVWSASFGAFAKVWPAALAVPALRNRLRGAIVVALSGIAALALTFSPGFTSGRRALGIHAETLLGSVIGLARSWQGSGSGVVVTTAAYLPVETWVPWLNAGIGLLVATVGLWAVWVVQSERAQFLAIGAVVVGMILASHLFSLQFVLWLTPFIALARWRIVLVVGVVLAFLTLFLAWRWEPVLFEEVWWYGALLLKNALVAVCGSCLAAEAIASRAHSSSSRVRCDIV